MFLPRSNSKKFSGLFLIFRLLNKNSSIEKIRIEKSKEIEPDLKKIRCPHCFWQPKASSVWFCSDCDFPEYFYKGCGNIWNTFETGGKCSACGYCWRWTSCLSCSRWALHEDWYERLR